MWAKNKQQNGFTIVELLIVIVVIGILAAITIVAFNGVSAKARDTRMVSNISAIQKKLEVFYTTNGYYPSNAEMQQSSYRVASLDIPSTIGVSYCWASDINMTCYVSASSSGDCNVSGDKCLKYRMSYRLESKPTEQVVLYSPNWTW